MDPAQTPDKPQFPAQSQGGSHSLNEPRSAQDGTPIPHTAAMSAQQTAVVPQAAVPLRNEVTQAANRRLIAPDLARGMALLGIAIANAIQAWSLAGGDLGYGIVNNAADQVAALFGAMFVHVRGIALFSTLLGYGIGMIYSRELQRSHNATRIIFRRYAWLAVFGVVHCIFLFWGDIMLFYGLAGMFMCLLLKLNDKALLSIAGGIFAVWVIVGIAAVLLVPLLGIDFGDYSTDTMGAFGEVDQGTGYLGQLFMGFLLVLSSPFSFFTEFLMLGPCIIVGFVAGRRSLMELVSQYGRLLKVAATITLVLCVTLGFLWWGGAQPWAPWQGETFNLLNMFIGPATGPGFLAVFTLVGAWFEQRGGVGPILGAITALGSMSMSGYVAQSVLFGIIMAEYGFGIGIGAGAAFVSLIGLVVWLITVFLAVIVKSLGKRGPLETLHRKLGYAKKPPIKR